MKLRYRKAMLNSEHARGVAQDPVSFGDCSGEHSGIVGQEHTGKPERPDDVEEVRDFVGCRAVDGSGHDTGIVRHDGHTLATQPSQAGHDGSSVGWLDLEQGSFVDESVKN